MDRSSPTYWSPSHKQGREDEHDMAPERDPQRHPTAGREHRHQPPGTGAELTTAVHRGLPMPGADIPGRYPRVLPYAHRAVSSTAAPREPATTDVTRKVGGSFPRFTTVPSHPVNLTCLCSPVFTLPPNSGKTCALQNLLRRGTHGINRDPDMPRFPLTNKITRI